jgi:hypothetical protein
MKACVTKANLPITLLAVLSIVVGVDAQEPRAKASAKETVPLAGMAMQIVGRELVGIDCQTGQQTGFATAAVWYPYVAGIPDAQLFQPGATVQNETTAILTTVFPKVVISATTNDKITNIYLQPHQVFYYYHPKSSPKDWTDFDGFQAGDLVGVLNFQKNMASVLPPNIGFGVNSGPWSFTKDFKLPNGATVNLADFTQGITVHVMGMLGYTVPAADGKNPVVVNLTNSTGPVRLGSCAVMTPFSGAGIHSGFRKN